MKLICVFVFAYADCWFSHEAAHILGNRVFKDYKYSVITLHDFPALTQFSTSIVRISEGTFCCVGVHMW